MTDSILTETPEPQPTKKSRRWLTPVLVTVALLAGVGIGSANDSGPTDAEYTAVQDELDTALAHEGTLEAHLEDAQVQVDQVDGRETQVDELQAELDARDAKQDKRAAKLDDREAAVSKTEDAAEPAPEPEPVESELTAAQEQAIGSAGSYLEYTAFSRSGLIEQLEFEGFSTKDATFAVDSVDVNWKEQAAKSAEAYLEYTSFSHSGLVEQLVFEGFTQEQAEYGVGQAGL